MMSDVTSNPRNPLPPPSAPPKGDPRLLHLMARPLQQLSIASSDEHKNTLPLSSPNDIEVRAGRGPWPRGQSIEESHGARRPHKMVTRPVMAEKREGHNPANRDETFGSDHAVPSYNTQIHPPSSRHWGNEDRPSLPTPSSTLLSQTSSKTLDVQQWAADVTSPPNDTSPDLHLPVRPNSQASIEIPNRPDSAKPLHPPVTLFISDDEGDDSDDAPATPPTPDPRPPIPEIVSVSLLGSQGEDKHGNGTDGNPWPSPDVDASFTDDYLPHRRHSVHSQGSSGRHRRQNWWRISPHPLYSPTYAERRLSVVLPFPMRVDHIPQALTQHFARYGTITRVYFVGDHKGVAERGAVVFQDISSIHRCFDDPKRQEFSYQSGPLVARTSGIIKIHRCAIFEHVQRVCIRLDRRQGGGEETRSMPHRLTVATRPSLSPHGKIRFWPIIVPPGKGLDELNRMSLTSTGKQTKPVHVVHCGPDVPEHRVVIDLVACFAEIIGVTPPAGASAGWVFAVGGPPDARRLVKELQNVPGLSVRYATSNDTARSNPINLFNPVERIDPLTAFERHFQTIAAGPRDLSPRAQTASPSRTLSMHDATSPHSAMATLAVDNLPGSHASTIVPRSPSSPSSSDTTPLYEHLPPPACHDHPHHPALRRGLVHCYKDGRAVVWKSVGDREGWVDECAVHISRLVKRQEDKMTLNKRFSRYGTIASIEYSPHNVTGDYATARVLYHERGAAIRAIEHEHGQVYNGSAIKVVERIVQASDVQVLEMYLTPAHRIITPEAAAQWTPPTPPQGEWQQLTPMSELPPPIGHGGAPHLQPPAPPHPHSGPSFGPAAPVPVIPHHASQGMTAFYPPYPQPGHIVASIAIPSATLLGPWGGLQTPYSLTPPLIPVASAPMAVRGQGSTPFTQTAHPTMAGHPVYPASALPLHAFGISYSSMPAMMPGYPSMGVPQPHAMGVNPTPSNLPSAAAQRPLTPPQETSGKERKVSNSPAATSGLTPRHCVEINGTYTAFYDRTEFEVYCREQGLNKEDLLHPRGPVRLLGQAEQ